MTCTTTVHGSGLADDGTAIGNYGDYTFTGRVTFAATTYNGHPGLQMYIDGVSQGSGYIFYPDAYIVSTTCPDPTASKYDCINGACTKSSVYSTPGLYATLSACQVACGAGCSGTCVSSADWAQIEGLANKLRNGACG